VAEQFLNFKPFIALLNNGTTELPVHNELFFTFHFAHYRGKYIKI
jgi:hypothetical protein